MKHFRFIIIGVLLLGLALGVKAQFDIPEIGYDTIGWVRPTTDEEWARDSEKDGLNTRFDYQLEEMKKSHEAQLPELKKLYDKAVKFPDAIRDELVEQGLEEPDLTEQVNEQIYQVKFTYERVHQIIERIDKEIELRQNKKVDRDQDILAMTPSTPEEEREMAVLTAKDEKKPAESLLIEVPTTTLNEPPVETPPTSTCDNGASDYPTCTPPVVTPPVETQPAEEPPVETPPVVEPAPVETPLTSTCDNGASDYPTCTPPVVTPPVEPPPAEEPPAVEPPAETPPAEEPPAEIPPVVEPPAETPPVETPVTPVPEPPPTTPPAETPPASG